MKVDIWSDIRCPFCYIGKRKFEAALNQFAQKEDVEITWRSFQLDPSLEYQPGKDVYEYLAERKGQTREWSVAMHHQVSDSAKEVGLTFNFDKAIIANSFNAQRLIQMATKNSLGNEVEEALFRAYFTEGKNIGDDDTLVQIGASQGLNPTEIKEMLTSGAYAEKVQNDEMMARELGVRGVPFFVINEKFGVSGAQPTGTFLKTLEYAWQEMKKEELISSVPVTGENACSADGC